MSKYIPPPNFDRSGRPTLEYLDDLHPPMTLRCGDRKKRQINVFKSPFVKKMWTRILHSVLRMSECMVLFTMPPLCLILAFIFVCMWAFKYRGGIAMIPIPDVQFNLHPIIMVFSLITVNGLGLLMFRFCKCTSYSCKAAMHIVVHGFTLVFAIIGIIAMKSTQEQKVKMANTKQEDKDEKYADLILPMWNQFESIHAHLGAATIVFYCVHFLFACSGLMFMPCFVQRSFREAMAWIHSFLGFTNFMLAIGTACAGFSDYARIRYKNQGKISDDENTFLFYTCIYLLLLGFVIAVALRRSSSTFGTRVYSRG